MTHEEFWTAAFLAALAGGAKVTAEDASEKAYDAVRERIREEADIAAYINKLVQGVKDGSL